MTFRRAIPSLVMTTVLIVSAVISLGMPDLGLAGDYLGGGIPTEQSALAVASIVCWVLIAGVGIATLTMSIRTATDIQLGQRRWTRATMFVASGVVVLGMGALNHVTTTYSMCCGSDPAHIAEAQQLVQSH